MYFEKEVMEKIRKRKQLEEIGKILGEKTPRNYYGYKLYDSVGEPEKPKTGVYTVSKDESKKMKSAKIDPKTAKKIKKEARKNRKNNKKKKGIIIGATSLVLAGVISVSWLLISSKFKKKNVDSLSNSTSISDDIDKLDTGNLDSLGVELSNKENKHSEYTKVSGDFNIEDITVGSDGLLYVDEESAKNASKSGTSVIDTKGGTLVVADNGKVYTKEEKYEIVDEDGNVIESGDGIPAEIDEGINYVECPCYFYDDFGNEVHEPGELITPEELENCWQQWHTTKPQGDEYAVVEEEIIYEDDYTSTGSNDVENENNDDATAIIEEETSPEPVNEEEIPEEISEEDNTYTNSNEGVYNADGTYTIYGVTYASYYDYQQYIIDGGVGYGYIDGIIQPIGDYEIEKQYTL